MPLQPPRQKTPAEKAAALIASAPKRMAQFDALPSAARAVINEYGDAAWKALQLGWSPSDIQSIAEENEGRLDL